MEMVESNQSVYLKWCFCQFCKSISGNKTLTVIGISADTVDTDVVKLEKKSNL